MPTVAFRTIRSRRKFANYPQIRRDLGRVLDTIVKPHLIQRFEIVVKNWKHQPVFKGRKFIRPDKIWVNIFPSGDKEDVMIYKFVTGGTRKHLISARNAPYLAFMWGGKGSYKPKTKPVGKIGGPGIVVGGTLRRPFSVRHPGSKARNFEKAIKDDEKAWFSRTMENAWRRAIRRL